MDTVKTNRPNVPEPPGTQSPPAPDPNTPQAPAPPARFTARHRTALITASAVAVAAALTTVLVQATDNGPHHANTGPAVPKTPVTCTLTVHGRPVQHATAYGTYGRATCTTAVTTP